MTTVVTQYSLDHYLAQQWNLDIEKFPNTLPASMETVKKMFHHYSYRDGEKTQLKGATKATYAKKLKEWTKGEEEKALMDLEIMYLKSNQDPKLYEMIMGSDENDEELNGWWSQKQQKKKPVICKQTPLEYFKLPHCRDMVPTSYQETMVKNLEPLHQKLKQEYIEFNEAFRKERKEHPNTIQSEFAEIFFQKKREKEVQDYKDKLKVGQQIKRVNVED